MKEIWKDIKGYEGKYQVSNLGGVRSLDRKIFCKRNNSFSNVNGKQLRVCKVKGGYGVILLGKKNQFRVSRLVAQAFLGLDISNIDILVCHKRETLINGMLDNSVDNLFLGTHKDNMQDMYKKGRSRPGMKGKLGILNKNSKKINQYTKDGKFIKTWDSIADIKRTIGNFSISKVCKGQRKIAGGYKWKYYI